jgi:hypothetical protein
MLTAFTMRSVQGFKSNLDEREAENGNAPEGFVARFCASAITVEYSVNHPLVDRSTTTWMI